MPAPEVDAIRRFAKPHVQFAHRHVDDHGVEVIPTPGHTPGSTCFLVPGTDASTYLFTGDTVFLADSGVWTAGFIPGVSDADALDSSLKLLSILTLIDGGEWRARCGGSSSPRMTTARRQDAFLRGNRGGASRSLTDDAYMSTYS